MDGPEVQPGRHIAEHFAIVVIGASAGGVQAISRVVHKLPKDFEAAVFVAMHFPPAATSVLPRILSRGGALEAQHPRDGDTIVAGRIYVAPPDRHLLTHEGRIRLVAGPGEVGNQPPHPIDPMFRSAAAAYGALVIGVLLTGNLDDGTAGLVDIKRHGGMVIVQDPSDALFPSMPSNALEQVRADYVLPLEDIAQTLQLVVGPVSRGVPRRY